MLHTQRIRCLSCMVALTLCAGYSAQVLAQEVWQPPQGQQQPMQYSQPPQGQPYNPSYGYPSAPQGQPYSPRYGAPAPHPVMRTTRQQDDRRLNALATQYYAIDSNDPQVVAKLRHLGREVRDFNAGLKYANYDATDILNDGRKLEYRIASQRRKLEAQQGLQASPGAPARQDAPGIIPAPAITPVQSENLAPVPSDMTPQPMPAPAPTSPAAASAPSGAVTSPPLPPGGLPPVPAPPSSPVPPPPPPDK